MVSFVILSLMLQSLKLCFISFQEREEKKKLENEEDGEGDDDDGEDAEADDDILDDEEVEDEEEETGNWSIILKPGLHIYLKYFRDTALASFNPLQVAFCQWCNNIYSWSLLQKRGVKSGQYYKNFFLCNLHCGVKKLEFLQTYFTSLTLRVRQELIQ